MEMNQNAFGFGEDSVADQVNPGLESAGFDQSFPIDQEIEPEIDDGLEPEEREHLRKVAEEQEDRQRKLGEKYGEEQKLKAERREAGQRALNDWYDKRSNQIETRKTTNKEEEWAFLKLMDEHKKSKNPWEHIIDNCEINSQSKDVARLRSAMLARKGDIGRLAEEKSNE